MEQPRQTNFTADEFIAWALEQPAGRFELDNGVVVAMAPERVSHGIAKRNVLIALHNAIGARGLACQALPDGMSVRVNDRTVYEPDALCVESSGDGDLLHSACLRVAGPHVLGTGRSGGAGKAMVSAVG